MDIFNRLAGVRDVTKPLPPPPPPIPQDEPSEQALSRRASRASLPRDLHRTPSRKSVRSSKYAPSRKSEEIPPLPTTGHLPSAREQSSESELQQTGRPSNASAGSDGEFEWGPSHPCYPHVNPHCLPESEEYEHTRVIRVKRDWLVAGDLYPQYQNLYPDILDPLVPDTDFRFLVTNLNSRLEHIFNPWTITAWIDAILGVLTGFLWDDFNLASSKRGIRDLEDFVERWNAQKVTEGHEVKLVQLRRTGFMSLDFIVPDPGLDVIDLGGHTEAEAKE